MTEQDTSNPLLRNVLVACIAGLIGIGIWFIIYLLLQMTAYWIAPPVHGLIVGFAMKRFAQRIDTQAKLSATITTGLGCWLAYVVLYVTVVKFVDPSYTPTIIDGMRNFFDWREMVLMTVVGCIIAWSLTHQPNSPPTTSAR